MLLDQVATLGYLFFGQLDEVVAVVERSLGICMMAACISSMLRL